MTVLRIVRAFITSELATPLGHGRLNLSLETIILQPQWREVFRAGRE